MKIILVVIAIVICLFAVIYLAGRLIPVKHSATVKRKIIAPPEQVWERITDAPKFTLWRRKLKSVEIINDREWVEVSSTNDKIPMKIREQVSNKRLVGVINSSSLPYGGEWVYELQADDDATIISITENGEIYNPIFRFIAKYFIGYEATIKHYLDDLESSFK